MSKYVNLENVKLFNKVKSSTGTPYNIGIKLAKFIPNVGDSTEVTAIGYVLQPKKNANPDITKKYQNGAPIKDETTISKITETEDMKQYNMLMMYGFVNPATGKKEIGGGLAPSNFDLDLGRICLVTYTGEVEGQKRYEIEQIVEDVKPTPVPEKADANF